MFKDKYVMFKDKYGLKSYQTLSDELNFGVVDILDELYNVNGLDYHNGPRKGSQTDKLDGPIHELIHCCIC